MTHVTVALHFESNGMRIDPSLAGDHQECWFADHACAVVLPSETSDFGTGRSPTYISTINPVSWRAGVLVTYSIDMFRVEVRVESYLTGNHLPLGGPHDKADIEEARRVFYEAAPIATELARRYVDQVRVNFQQSWLGSSTSTPKRAWMNEMRDASGQYLAVGFDDLGPVFLLGDKDNLTVAGHRSAIHDSCQGAGPPLAESLLADARHVSWPTGSMDLRHAVLLAAIACEVKIKERLRELAGPSQQELIAVILENPRDVSLAATALLDKALNAVCGRSLRRDDKQLYKSAVKLFEDRNSIAHRGAVHRNADQLRAHVNTAQSLFIYLDSIFSLVD